MQDTLLTEEATKSTFDPPFFWGGGGYCKPLTTCALCVHENIAIPGQIPWLTSYRLKLL